jgi:hypothetical protein
VTTSGPSAAELLATLGALFTRSHLLATVTVLSGHSRVLEWRFAEVPVE